MERTIRLATAPRRDLVLVIEQQRATIAAQQETIARLEALVAQQQQTITAQQATIADLEQRLADLEQRLPPTGGAPQGYPGHKPTQAAPPSSPKPPRKKRSQAFVRQRSAAPDQLVPHAVDECPDCRTPLVGGWVKRRRQVIELALAPAQTVEHQYWERQCALCRRRWTPRVDLAGVVVGQSRLGVNLVSLIATLREQGRWPFETIRWYLSTFHQLELSEGALVGALAQTAQQGEGEVTRIRDQIRGSPVVHADETGWREQGRNGYVWSFSTPEARYFQFGRRTKDMVDQALGPDFAGVLVSDFYAAYDHYEGEHQRCWVHLLRDIHDLKRRHPQHAGVQRWGRHIHRIYQTATRSLPLHAEARRTQRERLERALLAVVQPFVADPAAPQRVLSQRIVKYLKELFVCVTNPAAPPDNNAAERSVRHLVIGRKISGGSRSPLGTAVKMALSTLFGTWRLRGLNPFLACRQLLVSPHP